MPEGPLIVGIGGASGAGKSSFARRLSAALNQHQNQTIATVLHEDSYYRARPGLSMEEKNRINYDHPDAFEHDLLLEHLKQLRNGKTVHVPVYDYSIHDRAPETIEMPPPRVLIVEGILVLHETAIVDQLDLAIFVEAPLSVCLERRIERDMKQRGRSRESIIQQFQKTVRPMYHTFVHPSRWKADLIVPSHRDNTRAADVMLAWIQRAMHNGDVD